MFKGIDVSKWQGIIDWEKSKSAGVKFAILREGYGKKSPTQMDKTFKANYEGAIKAGIPTGAYHYSYAESINDAKLEAQFCLENIKDTKLEYPICFDIEDSELLKLSTRTRTDICKAFCDTLEDAGYYAMIYCNTNWLKNYLFKDELLNKYDLWLAHWNVQVPMFECGIWQHSEQGKIGGISGNVDLNISYKDYPKIIRDKGLNHLGSDSGSDSNQPVRTHTVVRGDTLWEISKKYLGGGLKYTEIMKINGLESTTIYPGQVLKIDG